MSLVERKKHLSYNDVAVIPAKITEIEHRSECNPFVNGTNYLPIFTAPMSTVVNERNFKFFEYNHIIPILPRNIDLDTRIKNSLEGKWSAYSMCEFRQLWGDCDNLSVAQSVENPIKVLIDVANGHIKYLYEAVKASKEIYGDAICIMIGNIANPETYRDAAEAGADFIRLGIGGGDGCFHPLTKVKTENGDVLIKNIKPNDKVLTHNNVYKQVKNVFIKQENHKLIEVNGVKSTLNHQYYVINKCDKEKVTESNLHDYAFFIEAENLNKDKHLLIKNV